MIPILYDRNETAFTSNGLGRLSSCSRCIVTEERNGQYECEFDYPVKGEHFYDIELGRIIACTHDGSGDVQPYDIYKKSEPIDGVVTFNARHISYRLAEVTVMPFTASSCRGALLGLVQNSIGENPFTTSTDKDVASTYTLKAPAPFRAMLGGEENSILDVYGKGEYEWDKWNVILHTNRGEARSTTIRYGKNLIDYSNEQDAGDVYTAVAPFWYGDYAASEEMEPVPTLVTLPEQYITSGQGSPSGREVIVPMDLSQDFDTKPTIDQLRSRASSLLLDRQPWIPAQTVNVDFAAMWETEEYKDYEELQHAKLCDTIGIVVPMYKTAFRLKIVKTEYNVLLERYDQLTLGDNPTTYAQIITAQTDGRISGVESGVLAAKAQAAAAAAAAGLSIDTDTLHYLATDKSSGVTTSTAGWTTTVQQITSNKPYLWTYHTYRRSNGTTFDSVPVITGTYGKDGTSVTILGSYNTLAELQAAHPTGSKGDSYMVAGDLYIWNGSAWENVGQIQGPQGPQGPQGNVGAAGPQGVSVTAVQPQYYLSTTSTSTAGGSWQNTMTYIPGRYVWTRERISYSNGTTGYSTAVYNAALTNAFQSAANAYTLANNTNQHFWMQETGSDAGAHITEVTRDQFLADPANGGGNLLARSNGVAVRNGLADLASFQKDKFLFYDQNGVPIFSITDDYAGETSGSTDESFATLIRNNAGGGVHRSLLYSYRNKDNNGMVTILEGREDVAGISPYSAIGLRVFNSEEATHDEGAIFYLYSEGRFEFKRKSVGSQNWVKTLNMTEGGELLYGSDYYIKTVLFTFYWTPESGYVNKEVSIDISSYAGTPISATMEYNSAPTLAFFTPRIYDGKLYVRIMQTTQGSGQKSFRVKVAFRLPK